MPTVLQPSAPGQPPALRAARAVWAKLQLMAAFGTVGAAAVRGGKLLARGRFREFGQKLFAEWDDPADTPPPRTGPPLFFAGHILGTGGYDHVVSVLLDGLLAAGIHLYRDPRSLIRKNLVPATRRPTEGTRRATDPRLAIVPPYFLRRFRPDGRTAAFTMWETDTLPTAAMQAINRCGLVLVPSRWGADCFRANGVTVPIEVVPLGYDPDRFGLQSPPAAKDGPCILGTAGALDAGGLRKNVRRVIDLFRQAFPSEPDARLRVKITPLSPMVETHGDRRIEVIRHSLSPGELAEWYRSLTAFVNGSFGEGFGLHLLEAMACGRPLISTTFGGAGEFFDASVGYDVGYRLVEARNAVYRGRWADPNDGEVIARMRQVYRDRGEARRLGERAAARAARFTWGNTIRTLTHALTRHGFIAP